MALLKIKAALTALLFGALILGNIPGATGAGVLSLVGIGPATSGPPPATVSLVHSAAEGNVVTGVHNITYNSVNFGPADSTRVIFVGVGSRSDATNPPNAITIGGVGGTLRTPTCNYGSGSGGSTIWSAAVPTGTSGSVVISFPARSVATTIMVWSALNLQSVTPIDNDCDNSAANPATDSLNTSSQGFAIAMDTATFTAVPSTPSTTWSVDFVTSGNVTTQQSVNTQPCPNGTSCILGSGGQSNGTTGAAISFNATSSLTPFTNSRATSSASFR